MTFYHILITFSNNIFVKKERTILKFEENTTHTITFFVNCLWEIIVEGCGPFHDWEQTLSFCLLKYIRVNSVALFSFFLQKIYKNKFRVRIWNYFWNKNWPHVTLLWHWGSLIKNIVINNDNNYCLIFYCVILL